MPRRPAPGQLHAANSLSLPSCTKMWLQFTPKDLISNKDLQNREVVIFEPSTEELQSYLENHTPRGSFSFSKGHHQEEGGGSERDDQ